MLLTELCPRRYRNPARGDLTTVGGFRHKADKYSRLTLNYAKTSGIPGIVAHIRPSF